MDDLVSILKQIINSDLYLYALCFFISVLFVYKLTKRSKLNPPPSPPKLPILGNFLQLGKLPHRTFRTLCEKYGPLMLLHLGQTPLLVVQSAELCKEICSTHDVAFANRFQTATGKIFFYERKDVAFAPYGEEWRQKKKLCVVELLSQKRVRSFHPIIKEEVAELLSNIRKACESKDSSVINLTDMLIEIANTIVCRCVLGISNDSSSSFRIQGRKMVNQFADIFIGDFFPWLGFIDTLGGKIAASKATFKVIDGVFDEVIAQHKKRRENNQSYSNDFVGILLELQESGELKFELTNHSIKAIVMDMFVGGADTTSAAIEWAFAELIKNPNIMKKAQEEVRRVVGTLESKQEIGENDLNQMSYLKWIIKESFRLHPPLPLVTRAQLPGVKLKGYDIPPNTMVFMNAWKIQRDPELWENPEEFIPERFENIQVDMKAQDCNFIPFGLGRRGCPGYSFAFSSIEHVLANLLYWFDWKLPAETKEIDMDEMIALTLTKKIPLHLVPTLHSF